MIIGNFGEIQTIVMLKDFFTEIETDEIDKITNKEKILII